ncbi:MAG: replicative DNA helicase [Eubacterium sp.]|nr:replicative DNA helicase [Eubacterium sp.]
MEEELMMKKVMPHDLKAEQSVIGSVLIDNDTLSDACEILSVDDFYDIPCKRIFEAIKELYKESAPVDLVTLSNKMSAMGVPADIRSPELLSEIINTVPTSTHIDRYVKIVRDKSYMRQVLKLANEISDKGYKEDGTSEDLLQSAEAEIFKLSENFQANLHRDGNMHDIMMDTINSIEAAGKAGGRVTGISTGFRDLDYMTAGLQPSELILIAARPAMGKTAFALNIAEHAALKENVPTVIFSLEMSSSQLAKRLLSMNSHVDSQKIRTGQLSIDEWRDISESANLYANSKIFIDDTPGITLTGFRTKCRKLKASHDIKLVIIDYLQLMSGDGRSNSRQEEISTISRGLKLIAREINCPIIALSQLSRGPESRTDKRPMLSDLRESGAIEQDADMVMFLYRDDYYPQGKSDDEIEKGVTEVIIGKQRNGPIGTVKLRWLEHLTKFANLEKK